MNKTIKCTMCKRTFATKAALSEHVSAKHQTSAPKTKNRRPRAAKQQTGLVLQTPMAIRPMNSDTATITGTDQLTSIDDVSVYPKGYSLFSEVIQPGMFLRLKAVATAFQRIRWDMLRFRVEPQLTSATSGGYCAAFVADPSDKIDMVNTIPYMMAQKNSVSTKWWQGATVTAAPNGQWLYTSLGSDLRECSPGQFVVAATGRATQKGNLLIYVDWKVTLSGAGFESSHGIASTPETLQDIYLRKGYQGLFGYTKVGSKDVWVQNPRELLSDYKPGAFYQLPWPVSVQDGTSDSSFAIKVAHYIEAKTDQITLSMDLNDKGMANNALDDTLIVPAGTTLTLIDKSSRSENFQAFQSIGVPIRGGTLQQDSVISEQTLMAQINALTSCTQTLSELLSSLRKPSQENQATCLSKALRKSTESLASWEDCSGTVRGLDPGDHLPQNQNL